MALPPRAPWGECRAIGNVYRGRDDQSGDASDEPFAVRVIDQHSGSVPRFGPAGRGLRQQAGKKLRWIYAMRRIVRAGINTARLRVVVA